MKLLTLTPSDFRVASRLFADSSVDRPIRVYQCSSVVEPRLPDVTVITVTVTVNVTVIFAVFLSKTPNVTVITVISGGSPPCSPWLNPGSFRGYPRLTAVKRG